jgi:hypothetical protein
MAIRLAICILITFYRTASESPFDCDLKNLSCQHQRNIFVGRPSPLEGEHRPTSDGSNTLMLSQKGSEALVRAVRRVNPTRGAVRPHSLW